MVGNMLIFGQAFVERTQCGHNPTFSILAPVFYGVLITLFVVGIAFFHIAEIKCGPKTARGALVVACLIFFVPHDIIMFQSRFGSEDWHSRINLWLLAPLFGATNVVAVTKGLGTLPWGTTGHLVTLSSRLGDVLLGRWDQLSD